MGKLFSSFGRIFFALCVFAFFTNIGLLIFAQFIPNAQAGFELQTLSLVNMILLSFVLLRDSN